MVKILKNINKTQNLLLAWFISSCLLSPNLINKIYFPPLVQLIFILLFIIIVGLVVNGKLKINPLPLDSSAKLLLIGLFLYLLGTIVALIFSPFSRISLYAVFYNTLIILTFIICLLISNERSIKICMNFYTNFMTVLAFFSIILLFLVLFTSIQPIGSYTFVNGRVYQNYLIGLTERVASVFTVPRAISFYNEPGTFGMMLVPAIFWSFLVNRSSLKIFILLSASFLTFSVGSWLTIFLIYLAIVFNQKIKYLVRLTKLKIKKKTLLTLFYFATIFCMVSYAFMNLVDTNYTYLFKYFFSKFYNDSESMTSGGQRVEEIFLFFKLLFKYPAGIGGQINIHEPVDSSGIVVASISVGTFKSIIEVGIIGGLGYIFILISLLGMSFQVFKQNYREHPIIVALSAAIISMILMGLQRADLFSLYVAMFMCAFFVRFYLCNFKFKKNKMRFYIFQ